MAGKLTIRRIGVLFPALSLVALLLLGFVTVWCSLAGLPQRLVHYVEERAADEGLYLTIGRLRLDPLSGLALKADEVRLYPTADKAEPWVQAGRVQASLNLSRLFLGRLSPGSLSLKRGSVRIPLDEEPGSFFTVRDIAFQATFRGKEQVNLRSGSLCAEGVALNLSGQFQIPSSGDSSAPLPSLPELVAPWQHGMAEIHRQAQAQQWQGHEFPQARLQIRTTGDTLQATCRASIPRFDVQQFHFREGALNLSYQNDTLVINSLAFRTEKPDATVSLQGGYNLETRNLSLDLRSSAALTRMLHAIAGDETPPLLLKFHHPDQQPPEIRVQGNLAFEDNWTLKHASVRGQIEQENLLFGNAPINHLFLSFFYEDGNFNIDHALLQLPHGEISASATAQNGKGQAQLQLNLQPSQLLQLVNEFTESEVQLPAGLSLEGQLHALLQAQLTTPSFIPGQRDWVDFVPSLQQLHLEFSIPQLAYQVTEAEQPSFSLDIEGIQQGEDFIPQALSKLNLCASAAQLVCQGAEMQRPSLSLKLGATQLREDGLPSSIASLRLQTSAAHLELREAETAAQDVALDLNLEGISLPEEVESIHIKQINESVLEAGQLSRQGLTLQTPKLELKQATGLSPLAPLDACCETLNATLAVSDILWEAQSLGALASAWQMSSRQGNVDISLRQEGEEQASSHGSLHLDWSQPGLLQGAVSSLSLNPAAWEPLLTRSGIELQDILLPQQLSLSGSLAWDTQRQQLTKSAFRLEIPELVRTSHRVPAHAGKRHSLHVNAEGELGTAPQGDLLYKANLSLTHAQGKLEGVVDGNLSTDVHFSGSSSLPLATLDELIDLADAHTIMRDFRQNGRSRTQIDNINTTVNYSNGLSVASRCNVHLEQTEYLLNALTEEKDAQGKPTGKESVRTDLGKNPFTLVKEATCEVVVQVLDGVKDAEGNPIPNEALVSINRPMLRYDNTPWFARQGFKEGTRETTLHGEQVNIDIEHSFVELKQVQGVVYPAYSLGMFYDDLYQHLEDLVLPHPAHVSTEHCLFPIYSDCQRPMSGVLRVLVPGEAGFRFLGTTIPLRDFSGFINISDDDVYLDRLNAKSWGGVLNAAVNIHIAGKRTGFDGYAKAQNMNLKQIAASYGAKLSPALCNGEIRFQTPSPDIKDLRAYGKLDIKNGDLLELKVFHPVGELITDLPSHFTTLEAKATETEQRKPGWFSRTVTKLFATMGRTFNQIGSKVDSTASRVPLANHFLRYDLQNAYTLFTIANGHLYTQDMKAKGYNLNVGMKLDINLETLALRGNLWPKISSVPTIVAAPLTFLSDFMIDIVLYGKVDDIQWKLTLDRALKTNKAPRQRSGQQQPAQSR